MSKPTLWRGSHAPRALGALSACIAMLAASSAVAVPGSLPDKHLGRSPLLVGNPIHAGTGNKYQAESDYTGTGVFPLKFVRHYNSQANMVGRIGYNWRVFAGVAVVSATAVKVNRADHRVLDFSLINGQWQPDADVAEKLIQLKDASGATTGWELTLPDGVVERYDAAGVITAYVHPSGLTHTVANAASSHATISDSFGRTLTLDYNAQNNLETLTDPAGGVTRYGYDANNNLVSVTYPDGKVRSYHYEDSRFPHALTGITDENGARYATWAYDAQSRTVLSEHAGGADRVTLVYNPDGSTTVTDALGTARTFGFQTVLGVVKLATLSTPCTSCGGSTSGVTYDANGNVTSRTDFNGNRTTYTYDLARNLEVSRTEAAGTAQARTVTTAWHPALRLPVQVKVYAGEGASGTPLTTTDYVYDAKGNLTSRTETGAGQTHTWSYTYNAYGQRLTEDGPRTDVADLTVYAYDAQGRLASVTNPLGQATRFTAYDAHGRSTEIVDANGVVATLAYDARGRLTSRMAAGETIRYQYDGVGQLTRVIQPDGSSLDYSYDAAHRLVGIRDGAGNRIDYTLDAMGNRVKEDVKDSTGTLARTVSRVYDTLNRLNEVIGAQ